MKKFVLTFSILGMLLSTGNALGGHYIFKNGHIRKMSATSDNKEKFWIEVSSGSGPCSEKKIYFSRENMSLETLKRVFSMAMVAFTSNTSIEVFSYKDKTCERAGSINLVK